LVAATTRTSIPLRTRSAPTGWISPFSRKAKQEGLHAQAHLADLVEEERAAVASWSWPILSR